MRFLAAVAWSVAAFAGQAPEPVVHRLAIAGFRFSPANLTVSPGDSLIWANEDSFFHTILADSGAFRSRDLKKGDRHVWVAQQRGRYPYHCSAHPIMLGVIVVH